MIGLRPAFTTGMNRIQLNEIPESGTPQLLYQIEVLALTFAMLGALSLYSIAFWALTNDLRLTQCFPVVRWPTLELDDLARAGNDGERPYGKDLSDDDLDRETNVLLSRLSRFRSLPRREEQLLAGQLALGGK